MLSALLKEFPALRGRVAFAELGTPLTSAFYLGKPHGESYGLLPTPLRFRLPWLQPGTAVPGLYLTGQDSLNVGVVSALISGIITSARISYLAVARFALEFLVA